MPRKRKTLSGAPAQAPKPPVDATYGEGERTLESQRRMPVPDLSAPGAASTAAQAPGPGAAAAPTMGPADRMQVAMQMLGRMRPGDPLDAPTQRPQEPLTAGLAQGPGPGPEVLRPGDRATRALRLLADFSDDPGLGELADLAQRMSR